MIKLNVNFNVMDINNYSFYKSYDTIISIADNMNLILYVNNEYYSNTTSTHRNKVINHYDHYKIIKMSLLEFQEKIKCFKMIEV